MRGLAHITGEGFLNLLRLEAEVGYLIDAPLPVPQIFELIAERGPVEPAELYEVFNMGCGFCCVVPAEQADAAVALLAAAPPGHRGDRARHGRQPAPWSSARSALRGTRGAASSASNRGRTRTICSLFLSMDRESCKSRWRVLAVAAEQHGVVTRAQLLGLGLSAEAIEHRAAQRPAAPRAPGGLRSRAAAAHASWRPPWPPF